MMRPFSVVAVVFICIVAYSRRFVKVKAKMEIFEKRFDFFKHVCYNKSADICNRMKTEE